MPATIRSNNKAKKIAFGILGTPPNLNDKRTTLQIRINKSLIAQDTNRIR